MTLIATRTSLHRVAEQVIAPYRVQLTGNEIALQVRPGGFGTPELPGGGWVGVSGLDVVRADGGRADLTSLRAAAQFIGLDGADALDDTPLELDLDDAIVLATAWATGEAALQQLIAESDPGTAKPDPIRLWPEHFDIATTLGDGAAGGRANYGVSPGDEHHAEPYAYVGPWTPQQGEFWNAQSFAGAEQFVGTPQETLAFFLEGRLLLSA